MIYGTLNILMSNGKLHTVDTNSEQAQWYALHTIAKHSLDVDKIDSIWFQPNCSYISLQDLELQ